MYTRLHTVPIVHWKIYTTPSNGNIEKQFSVMLAFFLWLCVSTLPSYVAIDYAGEACNDSPLSTCVESMILANKNASAREHMFVTMVIQVFYECFLMLYYRQLDYF